MSVTVDVRFELLRKCLAAQSRGLDVAVAMALCEQVEMYVSEIVMTISDGIETPQANEDRVGEALRRLKRAGIVTCAYDPEHQGRRPRKLWSLVAPA